MNTNDVIDNSYKRCANF